MEGRPKISPAQVVYGKFTYWLSIIAAMICTVGPLVAIAVPDKNFMNPSYLFFTIWQANTPEAVWQKVGGGFPGGHFWVNNFATGDGLTQFGLVIGCGCASLALLGTAITFLREKPRSYGWALVALFVATMVFLSALGIYQA